MKAVASRVTEKSDVLLLQAVDMDDSGPYEIAEPRVITALETYTPSCSYSPPSIDEKLDLTCIVQGCKRRVSSGSLKLYPSRLLPSRRSLSSGPKAGTLIRTA